MISNTAEFISLGIDPAASRASFVALYGDDYAIFDYSKFGKSGAMACAAGYSAANEVVELVTSRWPGVEIFAHIESPIVGRGGVRTTMVQCWTAGAILAALHQHEIVVGLANVSSWKKSVVGHGRATKEEVARFVELRWPAIFQKAEGSQDVFDATCIAHFGRIAAK
jgi:Holliday junction resolvasome RuvABC endonuclease subunit